MFNDTTSEVRSSIENTTSVDDTLVSYHIVASPEAKRKQEFRRALYKSLFGSIHILLELSKY